MRQKAWPDWCWPALIICSAATTRLIIFLLPGIAIRPILVMWFLFVCPGMTLVRFFRIRDIMIEWMLALALSVAIDGIVASIALYAGKWLPINILDMLISYCLVGAILQLATLYPDSWLPARKRQSALSGIVRARSTGFNNLRRSLDKG
jgi:hypothetical protein